MPVNDPESTLRRLGTQNWMAHQPMPPVMTHRLVAAQVMPWRGPPPMISPKMMHGQVIAAASCLLGEHRSVLQMAGERLLWRHGLVWAAGAISVLMVASFSKLSPQWHPHDQDMRRLQRVDTAVTILMEAGEPWLTSTARHVLFEEPEIPGKLWVMQVLKRAARIADLKQVHAEHLLETLNFPQSCDAPWPPPHGVFDILQGIERAETVWLSHHGGNCWPYSKEEGYYIAACHMAAREATGSATPSPYELVPLPPLPPQTWWQPP